MLDTDDTVVVTDCWHAPAELSLVAESRDAVLAFAAHHGMATPCLHDVSVAVTEALTNCARHAYPHEATGDLTVDVATDGDHLSVSIRDRGTGVAGQRAGIGIKLMRGFSDRCEIIGGYDGSGTRVLLEFSMEPQPLLG